MADSFLTELKRRNVFKVAVAYAIVAWLLLQVVDIVLPTFGAPAWVAQTITFVLILGFPVALIFAWAFELTPEGLKPSREVEHSESITQVTGRKIDFIIIGVLVLAVAFMFVDNYVFDDSDEQTLVPKTAAPAVEPAPQPPTPAATTQGETREVLANSVAVLPFENLSPDPDNAYFAAGIHEEVLNQLTKLSALNVIARTSMMQYAGGDKAIPQIAEELNVETVMEGSVRYADDRVLVTAQLIDPVTNAHLWSESYNREFADIFAIQADIAMNIANALEAEFSLEEQASIEEIPTDSPEAYRFYLAALDAFVASNLEPMMGLLDQAILADPEFATAYAVRARARLFTLSRDAASQAEFETRTVEVERIALEDIGKALEIDPNLAQAYLTEAWMLERNWRGAEAQAAYVKAYELGPNDTRVLLNYARFKQRTGDLAEAVTVAERMNELDPRAGRRILGQILIQAGEVERGIAVLREDLEDNPRSSIANRQLAHYEAAKGNLTSAKAHLDVLGLESLNSSNLTRVSGLANHYAQLGFDEDAASVLEVFEERAADRRVTAVAKFWEQLAHGNEEQALIWLNTAVEEREAYQGFEEINSLKLNYFNYPVLEQPEFAEARAKLGFQDI